MHSSFKTQINPVKKKKNTDIAYKRQKVNATGNRNLLAAVATGWAILAGGFSFISSLRLLFLSKSFNWTWSFEGAGVMAFRTAGAETEGRVFAVVWINFVKVMVCLLVVTGGVLVITIVDPKVGSWLIWFSTNVVVDGGCC